MKEQYNTYNIKHESNNGRNQRRMWNRLEVNYKSKYRNHVHWIGKRRAEKFIKFFSLRKKNLRVCIKQEKIQSSSPPYGNEQRLGASRYARVVFFSFQ